MKKFVRVKETLYSFKNGKIKVSVKPYEKYLEFDISRAWFLSRAKGEMGELVLNEKYLIITFRFKLRDKGDKGKIAWDLNKKSMDGFNPELRVDLRELFHIHRVYERKRRLQSIASRKPSLKKVLEKYSKREKNRAKDLVHKLTTFLFKEFENYVHGFEDLRKEKMFTSSKSTTGSYRRAIGR